MGLFGHAKEQKRRFEGRVVAAAVLCTEFEREAAVTLSTLKAASRATWRRTQSTAAFRERITAVTGPRVGGRGGNLSQLLDDGVTADGGGEESVQDDGRVRRRRTASRSHKPGKNEAGVRPVRKKFGG